MGDIPEISMTDFMFARFSKIIVLGNIAVIVT